MNVNGSGTSIQFGLESVFKDGATPTTVINHSSEGVSVAVTKGDEGNLIGSKTAQTRDLMSVAVSGNVSFILRPEFAGLLFHAVMGGADKVTTTGESTEHEFVLCEPREDLPSVCLVIDRSASVKKYPGVTIGGLSLDATAGDYVKGSFDIKGTEENVGTVAVLPKLTIPSYRCTAAVCKINGSIFDISSASFKIDNALEEPPKTYATGLYVGQPSHGKRSVTVDFKIPYSKEVETFKNTYLTTETLADVELVYTSTNSDYSLTLKMPNVSINTVSANIGGEGIIETSISGEALSVGATEPLTVVIKDKTTTAYGGV